MLLQQRTFSGRWCCMACLMVRAPVQVQKTCSRSAGYRAWVEWGEDVIACCQPHRHAVPCFMGYTWPPTPITPCCSICRQTPFQAFPMGASILTLEVPLLVPGPRDTCLWGGSWDGGWLCGFTFSFFFARFKTAAQKDDCSCSALLQESCASCKLALDAQEVNLPLGLYIPA